MPAGLQRAQCSCDRRERKDGVLRMRSGAEVVAFEFPRLCGLGPSGLATVCCVFCMCGLRMLIFHGVRNMRNPGVLDRAWSQSVVKRSFSSESSNLLRGDGAIGLGIMEGATNISRKLSKWVPGTALRKPFGGHGLCFRSRGVTLGFS